MFFAGDPLYVGFDLTIASFDSISEVSMVSSPLQSGVIQQLREPNFIVFWPSYPLEWTIVDILLTTYKEFTWSRVNFLLTTYLPTFSCPLSYWMTPFHEILLSDAMSVTQSPIIIQTPEIEFVEDFFVKVGHEITYYAYFGKSSFFHYFMSSNLQKLSTEPTHF